MPHHLAVTVAAQGVCLLQVGMGDGSIAPASSAWSTRSYKSENGKKEWPS